MSELSPSPQSSEAFDPQYLRLLPNYKIADTLFYEASKTLGLLSGPRQVALQDELLNLCWRPEAQDENDGQDGNEWAPHLRGEISVAWDDARRVFQRAVMNESLRSIATHKQRIDEGLESGRDEDGSPWGDGYTAYALRMICHAQTTAGIDYASDYVRSTALYALTRPDDRASVLLLNALGGDQASLDMGIGFLRETLAIRDQLTGDTARQCFDTLVLLMEEPAVPERRWYLLRDLSLELLAVMRQWRLASTQTEEYATAAARLGVICRNR